MKFFSNANDTGIVLTSRIRLARNIEKVPFPHMLSEEQAQRIINDISSTLISENNHGNLKITRLNELSQIQRQSMVEKHLISKELAKNYKNAAVITDDNENVSIMINEEDHIRLQVIYHGLKIKEAYEHACKIDDEIESKVEFAYDEKLGYLTSCPTNVGTGMRASVMVHLPGLSATKNINNIINSVGQFGMTIRGLYGEGSNAMGNIYQISNQVTLGLSEEEILNNLLAVTNKIIDQEKMTRNLIAEKQEIEFEDDIYRSLGILRYSRMIDGSECLNLLSRVRMGVEMGIIKDIEMKKLNELLFRVQPATIQVELNRLMNTRERDIFRAKMVREALKKEV